MRVLMFSPQFLPVVGGAERQADLLSAALLQLGVEVEMLTFKLDPSWPDEEVRPSGLPVRRIPYVHPDRRFPGARKLGLGLASVIVNNVRTRSLVRRAVAGFDLFHAHNASSPLTALAVRTAHRAGLPTLVKSVNSGKWFDLTVLEQRRMWGRRSTRWLVQDVDRWIAISRLVVEELVQHGIPPARIVQLPNGVAVDRPPVELPERATRFLHVGRLAHTAPRDVFGLMDAFSAASRDLPHLELTLVGGGDRLAEVRRFVSTLPAPTGIRIEGEQAVERWHAWAHCLVQPSFYEGMSNALLEGMSAGLACIAYDIPPNREALDGGAAGMLVPVGDHARLAHEIGRLAREPGLAQDYGRRARRRAETTYDIRHTAHSTLGLYESLIDRRCPAPTIRR